MKIYIRKIDNQCITHQMSFTQEIFKDFFDGIEEIICIGKKTQTQMTVKLLLATDPRFNNNIQKLLNLEGNLEVDDLAIFYKKKGIYIVELIKSTETRCSQYKQLFNNLDRHLLINIDNPSESTGSVQPEINETNEEYQTTSTNNYERNRIIFGAPGTGKSFMLNEEKDILLGQYKDTNYERVTFHPEYSYANFVGTYKPVPTKKEESKKDSDISYEYVPGPFMRLYVKAKKEPAQPFLLIIEEINRSNMAAVFGDIFQLLDRNDNGESLYPINANEDMKKHLSEKEVDNVDILSIPKNLYIWATMNSADQGVFPMDTAFKRRWNFKYIGIDDIEEKIKGKKVTLKLNGVEKSIEWNTLRKAINTKLSKMNINEDKLLGPYFISKAIVSPEGNEIDTNKFKEVFKNKVLMYLFEDAAKQKRKILFSEEIDISKYSSICKKFDEIGVNIFCKEITDLL